jgi:hypothetical protein
VASSSWSEPVAASLKAGLPARFEGILDHRLCDSDPASPEFLTGAVCHSTLLCTRGVPVWLSRVGNGRDDRPSFHGPLVFSGAPYPPPASGRPVLSCATRLTLTTRFAWLRNMSGLRVSGRASTRPPGLPERYAVSDYEHAALAGASRSRSSW